jgi:hypothetical protein
LAREKPNSPGYVVIHKLGNRGGKTGFGLVEGAAPYFVFWDPDAEVTVVSLKGFCSIDGLSSQGFCWPFRTEFSL